MGDMSTEGRFSWGLLLGAAVIGLLVFTAMATCQADTFLFLNVFVVAPALFVFSIASLVYAVVRRRQLRATMATFAVLWATAACVFLYNRAHPFEIRENVRWLLWSHEYKEQVLAQPVSVDGNFKHIEWDVSGFAGVANNTAYLVFDPTDALSAATGNSRATKFNGVPCKVRAIHCLENHWYAVLFYTDQAWGECN
jgi:hypothetical protein